MHIILEINRKNIAFENQWQRVVVELVNISIDGDKIKDSFFYFQRIEKFKIYFKPFLIIMKNHMNC